MMAVYIDDMRAPYGRMIMCHMMADTTEELIDMAVRIGMRRNWIQSAGKPNEHFDVSLSRRRLAIQLGAVEVTTRDLIKIIVQRRTK